MKRPSLLKAVLDSHRTKLNDFQLAEFNKAAAKSIKCLGREALRNKKMARETRWWHISMNDSMWAFIVFDKSHNLARWNHGTAMNKRTVNALEKKGVLKRIELHSIDIDSVWIIDGLGLNKRSQFEDSFKKLDGINPNADREHQVKIRNQILQEIKDMVDA
tara:strand:- start:2757 stop:3239 length:483 start_codon:yes stop_codon:yes gene_type:complete